MRRSVVCFFSVAAAAGLLLAQTGDADPWTKGDVLAPAKLAEMLKGSGPQPTVISVAFPVLYRQRHIVHAKFAGPGGKPEGIQALKELVASLPKNSEIILYCGCCPMDHCPNIRPAYRVLKEMGFTSVRIVDIPTNFHSDWVEKGYPVE